MNTLILFEITRPSNIPTLRSSFGLIEHIRASLSWIATEGHHRWEKIHYRGQVHAWFGHFAGFLQSNTFNQGVDPVMSHGFLDGFLKAHIYARPRTITVRLKRRLWLVSLLWRNFTSRGRVNTGFALSTTHLSSACLCPVSENHLQRRLTFPLNYGFEIKCRWAIEFDQADCLS